MTSVSERTLIEYSGMRGPRSCRHRPMHESSLSRAAQQLHQYGHGLGRLFRREASEQSALLTRDVRGCDRSMKKTEERRGQGSARTVPPIVDQDVEWRLGLNRVPPHIRNEYCIAGLEFSDLSRSGGPLAARMAREVGIVDIDQADRHTLRGEFEGSDIEIFQLFRRKQHEPAAPRSDAGNVVIEIEMRG